MAVPVSSNKTVRGGGTIDGFSLFCNKRRSCPSAGGTSTTKFLNQAGAFTTPLVPADPDLSNYLQSGADAGGVQTTDTSTNAKSTNSMIRLKTGVASSMRLEVANIGKISINKSLGTNQLEVGGSVKAADFKIPWDGGEVSLAAVYETIAGLPAVTTEVVDGNDALITSGGASLALGGLVIPTVSATVVKHDTNPVQGGGVYEHVATNFSMAHTAMLAALGNEDGDALGSAAYQNTIDTVVPSSKDLIQPAGLHRP